MLQTVSPSNSSRSIKLDLTTVIRIFELMSFSSEISVCKVLTSLETTMTKERSDPVDSWISTDVIGVKCSIPGEWKKAEK